MKILWDLKILWEMESIRAKILWDFVSIHTFWPMILLAHSEGPDQTAPL